MVGKTIATRRYKLEASRASIKMLLPKLVGALSIKLLPASNELRAATCSAVKGDTVQFRNCDGFSHKLVMSVGGVLVNVVPESN